MLIGADRGAAFRRLNAAAGFSAQLELTKRHASVKIVFVVCNGIRPTPFSMIVNGFATFGTAEAQTAGDWRAQRLYVAYCCVSGEKRSLPELEIRLNHAMAERLALCRHLADAKICDNVKGLKQHHTADGRVRILRPSSTVEIPGAFLQNGLRRALCRGARWIASVDGCNKDRIAEKCRKDLLTCSSVNAGFFRRGEKRNDLGFANGRQRY